MSPGPGVPRGLTIPARELEESFSHSSGPGGQHVNTSDTRVRLRFDVAASTTLSQAQQRRILAAGPAALDGTVIMVEASTHRSQFANRREARARLAQIVRAALAPSAPQRKRTRPTRGSQRRRLAAKRRRSDLKKSRARPGLHD